MSGGDSNNPQDFNLNLAPIIDCFTVLITYLLVSASFLTLAALEVGIATHSEGGDAADAKPKPELNLEIRENDAIIRVKEGALTRFEKQISKAQLSQELAEVKKRFPIIPEANLTSTPGVLYKDLIQTLEQIKKVYTKVFIAEG